MTLPIHLRNMTEEQLFDFAKRHHACDSGQAFIAGKDLRTALETCKNSEWIEWFLYRLPGVTDGQFDDLYARMRAYESEAGTHCQNALQKFDEAIAPFMRTHHAREREIGQTLRIWMRVIDDLWATLFYSLAERQAKRKELIDAWDAALAESARIYEEKVGPLHRSLDASYGYWNHRKMVKIRQLIVID